MNNAAKRAGVIERYPTRPNNESRLAYIGHGRKDSQVNRPNPRGHPMTEPTDTARVNDPAKQLPTESEKVGG